MKDKKEKRGRKPVEDKKRRIDIFRRESEIQAVGGDEMFKEICHAAISDFIFQLNIENLNGHDYLKS